MKNKIILLAICICFTVPMYSQSLDSLVETQVRPIIQANADLMNDMQTHFIKTRDSQQFKRILKKKRQSSEYIKSIAETTDFHEKMRYVNRARKLYHKARRLYERTNASGKKIIN